MGDTRRLSYEQIAALLTRIQERFGWDPIIEEGNIIGLTQVCGCCRYAGAATRAPTPASRTVTCWPRPCFATCSPLLLPTSCAVFLWYRRRGRA